MKPIPKQIQKAIDCGDFDRAARYLSASYLLMTITMDYFDMGCEILEKHGVIAQLLKREKNAIARHFSEFYRLFKTMITEENQQLFNEDWSELSTLIENFIKTKHNEKARKQKNN
jgi:hypothetical protein